MAFDALRLRNVIQLIGILSKFSSAAPYDSAFAQSWRSVFHLGLVVFAAIQIHETKAAVVRPNPTSILVGAFLAAARETV